jgi:uncharacterized phosphosugar-binding protein
MKPVFDTLQTMLGQVEETEVESIQAAGQLMADCLVKDGIIHFFGNDHRIFSPDDITTLNDSQGNSSRHSRDKRL